MQDQTITLDRPPFMFSNWELFEPLQKHRSFIVVFTMSAALSALLFTFVFSEKYQAETTIMFKPTEVTRWRENTPEAFGAPVPQAAYKVIGQTLQDVAKSEPLLRRVVEKLHLDVPESRSYEGPFYVRWYKATKDLVMDTGGNAWSILKYGRIIKPNLTGKAMEKLRKDIKISNADSYIFVLKVRDKHKDRVAAIANTVSNELVSLLQSNEQKRAENRRTQLRELLDKKQLEIHDYRTKIEDLLNTNHIASVAQETDKNVYRYSELELSRLNTEADIYETHATIRAYDRKLALRDPNASVPDNMARIQAEDFKRVSSEKLSAEVKLRGLYGKQTSLEKTLADLSARISKLPNIQLKYDSLNNQVERSERDYSLLNDALQEAVVQERSSATNLIIQNSASAPDSPVSPIKIYHVALASSLAIFLSVGLAFVFGYFNIRVFIPSKGVRGRQPPPLPATANSQLGGYDVTVYVAE